MEGGSTGSSSNLREETARVSKDSSELFPTGIPQVGQTEISQDSVAGGLGNIRSELIGSTSGNDSTTFLSNDRMRNGRADNATLKGHDSSIRGRQRYTSMLLTLLVK